MAGRVTQWGAGEIITGWFGRTTIPPATYYLALIKDVAPNAYVSGSELDEPDGLGYDRAAIPNEALNWSNAGQMQTITLETDVEFLMATGDWGRIRYWAITNAPVDGFNYFIGDIEELLVVSNGDTPVIGAGDLSISLGPLYTSEEL